MGKGRRSQGPFPRGLSWNRGGAVASQPLARVMAGGSAATRGGIPLRPPLLPTLAWDPGTLPRADVDCLAARMPPAFLARQPAGGLQGSPGSIRQARRRGLECALSCWQPVQDTHRGGKALIACSQTEGPQAPLCICDPARVTPRPCPHSPLVPATPGFALAFSQIPECACWLHGSCSWNWGDKAQTVLETWADRVQAAQSHA